MASTSNPDTLRSQAEFFMGGVIPVAAQSGECTICIEPLETDVIQLVKCKHVFHLVCALEWFNTSARQRGSCPLCRRELYEPEPLFVRELEAVSPTIYSPGVVEEMRQLAALGLGWIANPLVAHGSFSDSGDSVPSTPSTYMTLPRFTPTLPLFSPISPAHGHGQSPRGFSSTSPRYRPSSSPSGPTSPGFPFPRVEATSPEPAGEANGDRYVPDEYSVMMDHYANVYRRAHYDMMDYYNHVYLPHRAPASGDRSHSRSSAPIRSSPTSPLHEPSSPPYPLRSRPVSPSSSAISSPSSAPSPASSPTLQASSVFGGHHSPSQSPVYSPVWLASPRSPPAGHQDLIDVD
jgi:hypothetical protein